VIPSDGIGFRLPAAVVRQVFVRHAALVAAMLLVLHLAAGQSSVRALVGGTGLAVAVLFVAYAFTARHVWLCVSPAGVSATGFMGRTVEIPWSMPVKIVATRKSRLRGHTLSASEHSGLMPTILNSIFIPGPISGTPEFAAAIAEWAPARHPLRQFVLDAT
jgi:hypothetical protein